MIELSKSYLCRGCGKIFDSTEESVNRAFESEVPEKGGKYVFFCRSCFKSTYNPDA